jgi:hypothetical protein
MSRKSLIWVFAALAVPATTASAAGGSWTIDDFEDGDRRAAPGLSWISISDDLVGGASHADLEVTGANGGSRHALKVSGEVEADKFAGAWTALDGRGRETNASDFSGIRLRLRGAGTVQVCVRGGPMPAYNYAVPVELQSEWRSVDVPFEKLQPIRPESTPFDAKSLRWIGVSVRRAEASAFEFEIDDVQLYSSRDDARIRVTDGPIMAQSFRDSPASALPKGPWKELARDAPDDGKQKRLPDAIALATCADDAHGRVWFRIALSGPVPERWVGVNLALDTDGDPADGMEWWGTNKAFKFDRLVTVYGSVTGPGYDGMIGIADADEVKARNMMGSKGEDVSLVLDRKGPALIVGIPQSALGRSASPVRLVAAVGSAFAHNDDVPNEGAAVLAR